MDKAALSERVDVVTHNQLILLTDRRQAGMIDSLGKMKPTPEERVEFRFERGDQTLEFRLLQNTCRANKWKSSTDQFASASGFVHDHQVGHEFLSQNDCLRNQDPPVKGLKK